MIEMANEKSNFHFPLDAVRIDMIFAVEWLRIANDESFVAAVAMGTFACKTPFKRRFSQHGNRSALILNGCRMSTPENCLVLIKSTLLQIFFKTIHSRYWILGSGLPCNYEMRRDSS